MTLLEFIKKAPTAFHACSMISDILLENGFTHLSENQKWELKKGGKYFITRNSSSVIAFTIPLDITELSFNITAAHLDSPTFKLKPNFTISMDRYLKLNTEVYGGPIYNTWMDRPLNIAGRIIVNDNGLKTKLISFDKAMALIPNCPIHYNREVNKGVSLNPQIELLPIYADKNYGKVDLLDLIAHKLNVEKENIVSTDLYLSLLDRGSMCGLNDEFIMAPQIDNLECAFISLQSFIKATNGSSINILAEFDNEEIGSLTRQGAASTMLGDTLQRISLALGLNEEQHKMALANSFIVSCDNAQGYHPNYPSKYDPTNQSYLNEGIVIKNAARGSYTTDAMSLAYFKTVCQRAKARYQLNTNRSDIMGGSTLGAISLANVSILSIDIGLAQWAMHSAYETAGAKDIDDLEKALTMFYQMHLKIDKDGELSF